MQFPYSTFINHVLLNTKNIATVSVIPTLLGESPILEYVRTE